MAKIVDYPKTSTIQNDDVFLIDGENGTKGYLAKNLAKNFDASVSNEDLNRKFNVNDMEKVSYLMKYDKMLIGTESSGNVSGTVNDITFGLLDTLANSGETRRQCYRGKNIGTVVTDNQYEEINRGTFGGMFVGDCWIINGFHWRIVDFDYWYRTGDDECHEHHVVIMPDEDLGFYKMNPTNTTSGGYIGSDMFKNALGTITANHIIPAFGSQHILNHREYLTNAVTNGYPSGGAWYDSTVELPNEIMMYGSHIFTPAGNGTITPNRSTIDKTQLAAMAANPGLINPNNQLLWLRDVANSTQFSAISWTGSTFPYQAGADFGVRPVFGLVRGPI